MQQPTLLIHLCLCTSTAGQGTAAVLAASKYNAAVRYAASQTNYLGGTGLLYPRKSSLVRGMLADANAGCFRRVAASDPANLHARRSAAIADKNAGGIFQFNAPEGTDPAHRKLLIFYYNPDEPKLFVPKRTGLRSLNFARPAAWVIIAATIAVVAFASVVNNQF